MAVLVRRSKETEHQIRVLLGLEPPPAGDDAAPAGPDAARRDRAADGPEL